MEKSDNIKYVEEVLEKALQFAGEHGGATKRGKQALREAEERKQKTIYDDHFEADHEASLEENHADWLEAVKDAGLPHPKDQAKQKRIVSHMMGRAKEKSMGKSEEMLKFDTNGQWSLVKRDEDEHYLKMEPKRLAAQERKRKQAEHEEGMKAVERAKKQKEARHKLKLMEVKPHDNERHLQEERHLGFEKDPHLEREMQRKMQGRKQERDIFNTRFGQDKPKK